MKKKIAVFANGWNGENLDNFIRGLRDILDDAADCFVFASHASFGMHPAARLAENAIYAMPDYTFFDAAILFGSGINSEESLELILKKCEEADIPVVLQGVDKEGLCSVTVNNYIGMKNLCDHLIEQHQVQDVVFIGGSADNEDSNLRLKALRDALEEHGYQMDEEKLVYANWERDQVNDYLTSHYANQEKLPDAFVCANDIMALFAVMSLESIGIRTPEDVIVTGFDNLNEGRLYSPSVASVDQRYQEQGQEAARILLKLLKDRQLVEKKMIFCSAQPGESCGCYNCKDEINACRQLGHDFLQQKFFGNRLKSRLSRIEMCIMSSRTYEEIPDRIQKEFLFFFKGHDEYDETYQICVNPGYKKLMYQYPDEMDFSDGYFSPVMDVLTAKTDWVLVEEKTMNTRDLLLGYTGEGEGKTYVFFPLKIKCAVVGFMAMAHLPSSFIDNKYFEFSLAVNNALEKFQSNIKLANLNDKLKELMEKDSLTHVKNRVAYDHYMEKMMRTSEKDDELQVAIVMCDINNLKFINDNLGHDAGDIYIKNCSKLMCDTFSNSSVFRTGGDEFVILINTEDFPVRYERLAAMRKKMQDLAASTCSPLEKISIATGMSDFDPTIDKSLLDVVKRADVFMYMNKAEMKAKVLL